MADFDFDFDDVTDLFKAVAESKTKVEHKIYSKKILSNETISKLFKYQVDHVSKLMQILVEHRIALDASDTGIGKTYAAAAICKELERRPIIVCPKTLIPNWQTVLKIFGVNAYDIVNFETIKNGKTYKNLHTNTRIASPFVELINPDPNDPHKYMHRWSVPSDAILIVDEAHKCKSSNTVNGRFLMSARTLIEKKIPVLLLSGTISENEIDIKIPFFLMGKIDATREHKAFIKSMQLRDEYKKFVPNKRNYINNKNQYERAKAAGIAMMINAELKEHCARITIKSLGNLFPSNQWFAQQFYVGESAEIAEAYARMAELLQELKDNPGKGTLGAIVKLRQEIEFRKVPIFIEQARLYMDENKSVIIFVNFLDTLHEIAKQLAIKCKIYGEQKLAERQEMIDLFQCNKEKIIICQIQAGGVGISLHDLSGEHPRVSLINYPTTASHLIQALGRAARSGAKSPVLQRIIFAANVEYERRIMLSINKKLDSVGAINDGDLDVYKYKINEVKRVRVKKIVNV
jgi:SNF2 family DNA or RNA helicase